MQYKYVQEQPDYADLSSGRVFYSLPGHPAFPVRLASEIFQRCVAIRTQIHQNTTRCSLYDPCCGAAYHLSILAHLHPEYIREVIASDVDAKALAVAIRNLGLTSSAGLDQRIAEIARMIELYGKDSHREALQSAYALKSKILDRGELYLLETKAFQASAVDGEAISKNIQSGSVDIVFTDVPYGQHSQWSGTDPADLLNPLWSMLEALTGVLAPDGIVAVASDKGQKAAHARYQQIESFQIGKRRVVILKLK